MNYSKDSPNTEFGNINVYWQKKESSMIYSEKL